MNHSCLLRPHVDALRLSFLISRMAGSGRRNALALQVKRTLAARVIADRRGNARPFFFPRRGKRKGGAWPPGDKNETFMRRMETNRRTSILSRAPIYLPACPPALLAPTDLRKHTLIYRREEFPSLRRGRHPRDLREPPAGRLVGRLEARPDRLLLPTPCLFLSSFSPFSSATPMLSSLRYSEAARRYLGTSAIITLLRSLSPSKPQAIPKTSHRDREETFSLLSLLLYFFFRLSCPLSPSVAGEIGFYDFALAPSYPRVPASLSLRRVIRKWNNVPLRDKRLPDRAPCRIV